LNFPIHFPKHQEKDLEEKSYQRCENISTLDYVLEDKSENPIVSIQEEYHLQHAPLEINPDLSYAQSENNVNNEFKDIFEEPPLDVHEDFIQCGHGKNVAVGF
jgi:hypothetical protein